MASVRIICPVLLLLFTCYACGGVEFAKCKPVADIVFVVDSSDNIGQQRFLAVREFLAMFVRLIEDKVDKNQIRLALVTFSSSAELEFNLTDCPLANDLVGQNWLRPPGSRKLEGCLGKLSYRGGIHSSLVAALKKIREDVFAGSRPGKHKLAFVITEQISEDMHEETETEIMRLKRAGVRIMHLTAKGRPDGGNSIQLTADDLFNTEVTQHTLWTRIAHLTCTDGKRKRVKRSTIWSSYKDCKEGDIFTYTAHERKTCAVVHWKPPDYDKHTGGKPGDCFPEGDNKVTYEKSGSIWSWWSGKKCEFTIRVRVTRCSTCPLLSNAIRSTDHDRLWGSTCTYTCVPGYKHGSSVTTRQCRSDGTWSNSGSVSCPVSVPPELRTCRVSVSDIWENVKNSSYEGSGTMCANQRDEYINTQPHQMYVVLGAYFTLKLGSRPQISVGIVSAKTTLVKVSVKGVESGVRQHTFDGKPQCEHDVGDRQPLFETLHDCQGPLAVTTSLNDGESLCADMEAFSGGFYDEDYNSVVTSLLTRGSTKKRVCFTYDESKPVHCSELGSGCSSQPLQLSTRLTRVPEVNVRVEGWTDPIPLGATDARSASKIKQYRLEVHGVNYGENLTVDPEAISEHTIEWDVDESDAAGPFDKLVTLPRGDSAHLYAILLEVHDHAGSDGNVAYARRLLLYDNSSSVELHDENPLDVITAEPKAGFQWQTDITTDVCVDWKKRFYNTALYHINYLRPVNPDTANEIYGQYDQQTGVLPISGTDNVDGVIKFEMAWRCDDGPQSTFSEVTDVFAQATCLYGETLLDGQTYDIWIRATDIMGNTNEDSVRVSIDHTGPVVNIVGLRGRFGRDGLYVHNTTDLSAMLLVLKAEDPHSGLLKLQWTLGTQHLADDVGKRAVAVQRLDSATDCTEEEHCYCPSVGVCEVHQYLIQFNNLVHDNSHKGDHHRHYYFTITATNHASLQTTKHIEILVDDSPPTAGVVSEGLDDDDKAEMDFTSSSVVHVHWHGFRDHESGVLMYRVALASRCLTLQELEDYENSTVLENGQTSTSFQFPSEGHYFTTVVAYNGGMEPSDVSCSDGITYDTTPPRLVNVTLTHARFGQHVACTQPDEAWLVNSNMTRVRLASSQRCLTLCGQHYPAADPHYLPLSSNHTVDQEASDLFCLTLAC